MASPPSSRAPTPEELAAYLAEQAKLTNIRDLEQEINLLTKNRLEDLKKLREEEIDLHNKLREALELETLQQNTLLASQQRLNEARESGDSERIRTAERLLQQDKKNHEFSMEEAKNLAKKLDNLKEQQKKLDLIAETAKRERNIHKEILDDMKSQLASATGLGDVFKNMLSGMNPLAAIFLQMGKNAAEMFTSVLEGNRQFAVTTGQIADRSASFGYGASQFGIGFEKMNEASMRLFTSMANFSNQSVAVKENLALSAAKMENLGVSAETTGKNFEALTLGLKMSSNEAIKTNEDIAKAAIGAGIAPSKMLGEFAANMPKLAAYGKQAVNVYIDLQKQAKSLGIELGSLTAIVGDQFDTFEGSARAAGKLNAVLGGNYLNSVEMLNATESERIVLLKKSFDESGKNFDALEDLLMQFYK